MIVFFLIITICLVLFIIPFFVEDTWWLYLLSGLILFFFSAVTFGGIRPNENPEYNKYLSINRKFEYITQHDSIPFEMKTEIYEECRKFNKQLFDNDKYSGNIWVGFYYPDVSIDRKKMTFFDLNKIK